MYFVWVQKTSYLTYAFAALVEKEFSQIEFYDPKTGDMVPGMSVSGRVRGAPCEGSDG